MNAGKLSSDVRTPSCSVQGISGKFPAVDLGYEPEIAGDSPVKKRQKTGIHKPEKTMKAGLARRVRRWRMGRPENRFGAMAQRLLYLLRMTVLHGRIVRKRNLYGGLMHACLFGGFITLLAGTTLVMAGIVDNILNGVARPFFGWVSDQIGRENTMFVAFALEGIGIFALYKLGSDPVWFVILSGLVFFAWGEIYSLFPSTCTDTFGTKFATTNAGLLYTAKGTAALLVPYTNQIQKAFQEPRLLIVTDPRADHQAVKESSYVNIPVIALANTDSPLR